MIDEARRLELALRDADTESFETLEAGEQILDGLMIPDQTKEDDEW